MKHFAKINSDNLVTGVFVSDDDKTAQWFEERFGETWLETSEGIRKNFAGAGFTYDPNADAFIPPKPFESWILNEETAQWEAPVEYPADGKRYVWNEETVSWIEVTE